MIGSLIYLEYKYKCKYKFLKTTLFVSTIFLDVITFPIQFPLYICAAYLVCSCSAGPTNNFSYFNFSGY
jgi:hypothetical protein